MFAVINNSYGYNFFIASFVSMGINNLFFKSKEKIGTDMNNVVKLHLYIEGEKGNEKIFRGISYSYHFNYTSNSNNDVSNSMRYSIIRKEERHYWNEYE